MAIPIPSVIVCPQCGASENVTLGDTSVGPAQRRGAPRGAPSYSLIGVKSFDKSRRDGETWLSCQSCGTAEFMTVAELGAAGPGRRRR